MAQRVEEILGEVQAGIVTVLYSSKEEQLNNAGALKEYIEAIIHTNAVLHAPGVLTAAFFVHDSGETLGIFRGNKWKYLPRKTRHVFAGYVTTWQRLPRLKQVGERFKSVRYCLDIGFANLDRDFSFKQYVDDLAPRVAHLHLTDNYGQMDDHEPPGLQGGISRENWDYLLETLNKYDNDIIGSFEMCPCMPDVMIRQAREFLFDEMKWPNSPQKQSDYIDGSYNPM